MGKAILHQEKQLHQSFLKAIREAKTPGEKTTLGILRKNIFGEYEGHRRVNRIARGLGVVTGAVTAMHLASLGYLTGAGQPTEGAFPEITLTQRMIKAVIPGQEDIHRAENHEVEAGGGAQ